jgi:hypothetical protein
MTTRQAGRIVGFAPELPAHVAPTRVYVLDRVVASMVLPGPFVLSEFRGSDAFVLKKVALSATSVSAVRVGDTQGLWLAGAAHDFAYVAADGSIRQRPARSSGNVLLWSRNGLTFRLAGKISRADAVRLAETVNPS